jgi:hypothetical protein
MPYRPLWLRCTIARWAPSTYALSIWTRPSLRAPVTFDESPSAAV